MRPRSISASSINSFESCPAKFKATHIDRIPEVGPKVPAMVGTSVHYALEHFVNRTCMQKTSEWEWSLLEALYREGYTLTFNSADRHSSAYQDGLTLLKNWYKQTEEYLGGAEVLSTEQKIQLPIKSARTRDESLLTFILDRADLITEVNSRGEEKRIIRAVDYKTQREYVPPEKLKTQHRQARIYALAAAVHFRDLKPDYVEVQLDLLRYTRVGVRFSREDNAETRDYIRETLQLIIDTPDDDPPRRLSPDCRYCPIKMGCGEFRKNADNGGDLSLDPGDLDYAVRLRAEMEGHLKFAESNIAVIDDLIIEHAKKTQQTEFEVPGFEVGITASSRRYVDAQEAIRIVGSEIAGKISTMKVTDVDTLLRGDLLDEEQKTKLRQTITKRWGALGVKVKATALGD